MWTKNLKTSEEKKRFESSLQGSKIVLDRLSELLSEEEASITRTELSTLAYDTANWDYKQAHKNGQRSMLHRIQQLINLVQQYLLFKVD